MANSLGMLRTVNELDSAMTLEVWGRGTSREVTAKGVGPEVQLKKHLRAVCIRLSRHARRVGDRKWRSSDSGRERHHWLERNRQNRRRSRTGLGQRRSRDGRGHSATSPPVDDADGRSEGGARSRRPGEDRRGRRPVRWSRSLSPTGSQSRQSTWSWAS